MTVAASEGLFARERQRQIAAIVAEQGSVRVAELAARFGVSAVTIRKDLVTLEHERRLIRTHGGAISAERHRPELAFDVRERLQAEEKSRIGAFAAELVADGESIALDASTTALYVARHLTRREHWQELTVVTNGMRIASELAGHAGIVVLMPGGRVRSEALSLIGPLGASTYRRVNVQKAFVGAAGFAIESGLTEAIEEEAQLKRSMVAAAREVIAIVDHTKWGRTASATFARTEQLDAVIADAAAPPEMVAALNDQQVQVHLIDVGSDTQ